MATKIFLMVALTAVLLMMAYFDPSTRLMSIDGQSCLLISKEYIWWRYRVPCSCLSSVLLLSLPSHILLFWPESVLF